MAGFYPGEPRILSQPVDIHWAGWRTDTLRLQQAGWEISVHQEVMYDRMRIAMRHERLNLRGYTSPLEYDRYSQHSSQWEREAARVGVVGEVRHMGSAIHVHEHDLMRFRPVDATPQLDPERITSLDDMAHFAGAMVRTKQVVVPEEDVNELLLRILEKQQAAKTAYFDQQVRQEGGLLEPHKFHAQIISLPRAA